MGFCNSALNQNGGAPAPSSTDDESSTDDDHDTYVTEPPLGPRPDLLEDSDAPINEEYDESLCEVCN